MTSPRLPLPVRWKAFGGALIVVLIATLWLRFTAAPAVSEPPAPPPHSIAVMSFVNDTPDSSYDYLSQGITGDLTSVLGRIPGLRISASRTSSSVASVDPSLIGRRLGVGSVLLGTVRQTGDRLRVTAHLVSVEGGFDVWSEAYEREAAHLLDIENEIVGAIVEALRLRAEGGGAIALPGVARTTPAAHAAYLKGRYDLGRRAPDAVALADSGFTLALRLDSAYAPAWAGLAQGSVRQFVDGDVAPSVAVAVARMAAERAVALDSTLAEARIARAVIWLLYDRTPDRAGDELRRAIALDPNLAEGFHWQSHRLLSIGAIDSSLVMSRRAIEASPLDASLRAHLGWHYLLAREDSLAGPAFDQALALDSTSLADPHFAWRPAITADSAAPGDSAGHPRERYVSAYALAISAAVAGRTGPALTALTRAWGEHAPEVIYMGLDPRLDSLRGNRRFEALLARLRLTTIPTRQRPSVPQFASP